STGSRCCTTKGRNWRCRRSVGAKPILKNRTAPEVEKAVVEMAIEHLAWGQVRVSEALKRRRLSISPAGVRCVWARHDLTSMRHRLKARDAKAAQNGILLTDQIV